MSDKEKIELGVQLYFDSMYESSAEKVREAFQATHAHIFLGARA